MSTVSILLTLFFCQNITDIFLDQASSSMPIASTHAPLPPRVMIACPPTPLHNTAAPTTTSLQTQVSTPPLPLSSFPPTVPFTPPRLHSARNSTSILPSSSPLSLHPTSPVPLTPSSPPSSSADLSVNLEDENVQEQVLNEHAGIYRSPDRSIRAYVDPTTTPRVRSSIDLALPDVFAFQLPSSMIHGMCFSLLFNFVCIYFLLQVLCRYTPLYSVQRHSVGTRFWTSFNNPIDYGKLGRPTILLTAILMLRVSGVAIIPVKGRLTRIPGKKQV